MTPDEIAADRAVIDAATGGEWSAYGYEVRADFPDGDGCRVAGYVEELDAAFIAAARTGWPRALDALEVMADAVLDEMARAEKAEAAMSDDILINESIPLSEYIALAGRLVDADPESTPGHALFELAGEVQRLRRIERAEVADLKFDVERLEKAVDVLAASVNAATIRAEKAEAAIERVRSWCDGYDNHQAACAYWQPFPTGTVPVCDCSVRDLRAAPMTAWKDDE